PIPMHGNQPRSASSVENSAAYVKLTTPFPRMGINLDFYGQRNPVPLIFSWLPYSHALKQIGFNVNNKTSTANKTKSPPQEKLRHFNTTQPLFMISYKQSPIIFIVNFKNTEKPL
ncbi:TPA: hypothetical protein ACQYCS_004726, partial [Vibrio parahaemolyticus]|uniref:hypothetical protein n=1 Tax=Vibrio sp. zbq_2 TaxID=3367238 RepID=UPI00370B6514